MRASAIADVNNDNSLLASVTLHTRTYHLLDWLRCCVCYRCYDANFPLVALNGDDQTNIALIVPYKLLLLVSRGHVTHISTTTFIVKARNCSIDLIPDSCKTIHAQFDKHVKESGRLIGSIYNNQCSRVVSVEH